MDETQRFPIRYIQLNYAKTRKLNISNGKLFIRSSTSSPLLFSLVLALFSRGSIDSHKPLKERVKDNVLLALRMPSKFELNLQ